MSDTSTEAVERLAKDCDQSHRELDQETYEAHLHFDCAATLRALAAERDALRVALEYYAGDVGNGDVAQTALNAKARRDHNDATG